MGLYKDKMMPPEDISVQDCPELWAAAKVYLCFATMQPHNGGGS